MSIPSKALNLDENGAARVSLAANEDVATTAVNDPINNAEKIPETPLTSRRVMIIAFPTDTMFLGAAGVTVTTGYAVRGRKGGSDWTFRSARAEYSNRRQFLRGQYTVLRLADDLDLYIRCRAIENSVAMELS